jgi:hypothetical protein
MTYRLTEKTISVIDSGKLARMKVKICAERKSEMTISVLTENSDNCAVKLYIRESNKKISIYENYDTEGKKTYAFR